MSRDIADPDVQCLVAIAATLKNDYLDPDKSIWDGSPFAWIRTKPSRQRGKIGEQLVAGWCAAKGLDVINAGDIEADRIINGQRIEVKFSTLWAARSYRFQQLRNQNYAYAVCLGISPFDAHCWVIPNTVLLGKKRPAGVSGQHSGRAASDTAWLSVNPSNPHEWLKPYGGTLADAFKILRKLRKT